MWDKFNVRVSKLGRICYQDLCTSVLKISLDDKKYTDLLDDDDKYYINKKMYVSVNAVVKLLMNVYNKSTVKFCRNHLEELMSESDIADTVVLSKQKTRKYDCTHFLFFEIGNNKWYKAKNICKKIGYSNHNGAIRRHVFDKNKISFNALMKKCCNIGVVLILQEFIDVQTIFINDNGLDELLLSSDKPDAICLAKKFGINVKQKITRKEIDIGRELDLFCKSADIKLMHQKTFHNKKQKYLVDYYLPDHKIAIEIDEYNHKDRDPKYEKNREKYLAETMGCTFVRCNPDSSKFTISGLIGRVHKAIVDSS